MAGFLERLFAGSAIPSMEKAVGFSSARHRLLLENLANADTPGYRRRDLDVAGFQTAMTRAAGGGGESDVDLRPRETEGGPMVGMLRHDGNNVDVERELALLSRNGMFHLDMTALLRKSFEEIRMALAERPTAG